MTTNEATARAAGAARPEATLEEKLARLEQCHRPLDDEEIALFREVYRPLTKARFGKLRRRILAWGVAEADADDVLQDTLFNLFNYVVGHGLRHGFDVTLGKVARGRILNYLRDRGNDPEMASVPSSSSAPPGSSLDLDHRMDVDALVKGALPALAPQHRAVVEACFLEELTHDEAAARLDIPAGTVKSLLTAALRALWVLLAPLLLPSQRR